MQAWRYEGATAAPVPWPQDWPALTPALYSFKRGRLRLLLPGSEESRLQELLNGLWPGQTIESGDRTWRVDYRLPFPNEDRWMN